MCLSPPPPFNQPSDIGYGKEWEEKLKVYQAMRATLLPLPPLLLLLRPRRGGWFTWRPGGRRSPFGLCYPGLLLLAAVKKKEAGGVT